MKVYVVYRVDFHWFRTPKPNSDPTELARCGVKIKSVYSTVKEAEAETERLNSLNVDPEGAVYCWQSANRGAMFAKRLEHG